MDPRIDDAVRRLREERKSEETIRIWQTVLSNFKSDYDLSNDGIQEWIRDLREGGIKESSIKTYVKTLRRYTRIYGPDINWEYAYIRRPSEYFEPTILSRDEVMELLVNSDWELETMLRTAYECVTRPQELCNINRDDVDLKQKVVTIYGLKGSNTFDNPITNELKEMLSMYIQKKNIRRGEIFFRTSHKKQWNPNYLSSIVFKKHCKEILGKDIRMIDFCRHTRITHLLQDGHISPYPVPKGSELDLDLYYVILLSRHRSLNQILRYAHVAGRDVYSKLEKYMRKV